MLAGWRYRLPTEAEWEYACRAGTTTAFPFGDALHGGMANFNSFYEYDAAIGDLYVAQPTTNVGLTTGVGSYPSNAWGLYDMNGNLYGWCGDWYDQYPSGSATDPHGPVSGLSKVIRGGSWNSYGSRCRSAFRFGLDPSYAFNIIGLRVVLAKTQP